MLQKYSFPKILSSLFNASNSFCEIHLFSHYAGTEYSLHYDMRHMRFDHRAPQHQARRVYKINIIVEQNLLIFSCLADIRNLVHQLRLTASFNRLLLPLFMRPALTMCISLLDFTILRFFMEFIQYYRYFFS